MKVALINSKQDEAGLNIRHHLEQFLKEGGWAEFNRSYDFFEVDDRLINAEHIDREVDADLVVFISRHYSANPVPVLTVHATGNFGQAELGGEPRTLAPPRRR